MIEIYPTYEDQAYRIEMWGDQIDTLRQIDPLTRRSSCRPGRFVARSDLSEDTLRHAQENATNSRNAPS